MNVDKMPAGRELDALIAERVMGFEVYHSKTSWQKAGCPHSADWAIVVKYPAFWYEKHQTNLIVPRYSTDITAAWQVQIKIDELGLMHEYTVALAIIVFANAGSGVECAMDWLKMTSDFVWSMVHATPEQRCLAALKAVRERANAKNNN